MDAVARNQFERVSVQLKTLIDLAKSASALNLRHGQIRSAQSGEYMSRLKGRGMEFDETRIYQPGDDIRSIDWRVTARSDKTHTKIYREERERPVFIAVDYRPTMDFATRGVFKSVQAAKIAALLAWAGQRQGDQIGGQVFNQFDSKELKPKSGKHALLCFLNTLAKPNFATESEMDLNHVLSRLNHHARPGSLVYIISDFRGFDASSEAHLSRLTRHCELVLIHVYDPLESHLPAKGQYRLTDGLRDVFIDSGDKQRVLNYQQRFQQQQQYLQSLSKKWRVTLLQCATTDDPVEVLR
jgi:uncharacterized protein (DUF58 family)